MPFLYNEVEYDLKPFDKDKAMTMFRLMLYDIAFNVSLNEFCSRGKLQQRKYLSQSVTWTSDAAAKQPAEYLRRTQRSGGGEVRVY